MITVVLSAYNVVNYLEGGGHFWAYMQYAQGLRQLGCEVYWLERFQRRSDPDQDAARVAEFAKRMDRYGLGGKFILYADRMPKSEGVPGDYIGVTRSEAEAVFRRADLLLNFHYAIDPNLLSLFRRTALVNIDPGLLQFWISTGQLAVPWHDLYLTIGETLGLPVAWLPDCGLTWNFIRPPVCLERWPYTHEPDCEAFTTVSGWSGRDWLTDGGKEKKKIYYENTKRISFLEFVELPRLTSQVVELAACLTDQANDAEDRRILERHGWRIRHPHEVARTPEMYQAYVQRSRGEFSCAKPSYVKCQNAWVSDRTLCYLASGKPVVIQNTGPSSFLPNGEGMFRFSTVEEAVNAFETINADYERHCRAAREIAEAYFDSKQITERILNSALGK